MYYVIPRGAAITDCGDGTHHPEAKPFSTLNGAKDYAQDLHNKYNNHWHVIEVNTAWGTTTLHDLLEEDRAAVLNRNMA